MARTRRPLVVIASRIFTPEPSAASFMLEAVARSFVRRGCDVRVLTTRPPSAHEMKDPAGVTVRRAPVIRDAAGYVRGYVQYMSFDVPLFFRLLFSKRADLYVVEPPPTTGAVMRLATALLRRPYIYDAADLWSDAASQATSSKLVLRALRAVEQFAIRGASGAFAISPGLIARMREIGIDTPATSVGFGVDAEAFSYQPTARDAPTASDSPYFVYAGSYSEWHGADVFLDGFERFSTVLPGYRLLFYGNGSQRDAMEKQIVDRGILGVEFHSPVGPSELSKVLSNAVASLASLKPKQGYDYAFTTKVYASLASGCPIVFAGEGPTADFIQQHAATHPVGEATNYDMNEAAELLLRAARSPLAPAERELLSVWARDKFSIDRVADAVVESAISAMPRESAVRQALEPRSGS